MRDYLTEIKVTVSSHVM